LGKVDAKPVNANAAAIGYFFPFTMGGMVATLSEADMRNLAAYYAGQRAIAGTLKVLPILVLALGVLAWDAIVRLKDVLARPPGGTGEE
jgi:hypothetical protein